MYTYDRRGRGESGDTPPYAVEREVEDIAALIAESGGSAALYGHSSGACLAAEAARSLDGVVTKLAMYDAPWNDDPAVQQAWTTYLAQVQKALAEGRRGDAAALFMAYIGIPEERIAGMREAPFWSGIEAVAPTLAYDHVEVMGPTAAVPRERLAQITAPTLMMCGQRQQPFMCATAQTVAASIPGAQLRTLSDQSHDVQPEVLAPLLLEFLLA